jgi:cytochrome c5
MWLLLFYTLLPSADGYHQTTVVTNLGTYYAFEQCKTAHDVIVSGSPKYNSIAHWEPSAWRCIKVDGMRH